MSTERAAALPRTARGRPPQAGLAQTRREQIVHSAYAVLTDRGYDRTSIADIARHAQIGHGTVYRYFADKRELLDHVFDHAVAKLITAVNVGSLTFEQLAGFEQSLALIEVFGWRLFSLIDADPGMLTLITVQSSAIDPELRYRVVGMISALDAAMSVAFDTASPDWAAATDPMVRATFGRMMLAMSGPGVMSSLSPATQDRAHRQRCLDTVTAIADRGLLTAASPETADAEGSTAATASTTSAPAAGWGATGSSPAGTAEAPPTVAEEPESASAAAVVQRRRSQLYAAAWELFVQRGYRDVDVADITAAASVSQGTFYNYFPNKRAVLELMIIEVTSEVLAAMTHGPAPDAATDRATFIAAVQAMVERIVTYVCRRGPAVSFVALTAPGVDDDAFAATVAGLTELADRVTVMLRHGREHGWVREDVDLGIAGQAVACCVIVAVLPVLLDDMEAVDTAVAARVCSCYLLGGMRAAAYAEA